MSFAKPHDEADNYIILVHVCQQLFCGVNDILIDLSVMSANRRERRMVHKVYARSVSRRRYAKSHLMDTWCFGFVSVWHVCVCTQFWATDSRKGKAVDCIPVLQQLESFCWRVRVRLLRVLPIASWHIAYTARSINALVNIFVTEHYFCSYDFLCGTRVTKGMTPTIELSNRSVYCFLVD
jgi:hypothetical protein